MIALTLLIVLDCKWKSGLGWIRRLWSVFSLQGVEGCFLSIFFIPLLKNVFGNILKRQYCKHGSLFLVWDKITCTTHQVCVCTCTSCVYVCVRVHRYHRHHSETVTAVPPRQIGRLEKWEKNLGPNMKPTALPIAIQTHVVELSPP